MDECEKLTCGMFAVASAHVPASLMTRRMHGGGFARKKDDVLVC